MVQTQVDAAPVVSFPDRRRLSERQRNESRLPNRAAAPFTANAPGSTSTIVGANAAPATNDNNIARRGEKFQLYTSAGVKKEETVFEVTTIAVGASTTLTFAPLAAVATASGDEARWLDSDAFSSLEALDSRLTALGFTAAQLMSMTLNDKVFAVLMKDNPEAL